MSGKFNQINDEFWASPQIDTDDISDAVAMGVTLIVCNRPDGEALAQPMARSIRDAAEKAGIDFIEIPVGPAGISHDHLDGLADAIGTDAAQKTLAYCASGTRSTILYSYMAAQRGDDIDTVIANAAAAGYDIAGHRPALASLGAQRTG